MKKFIRKALLFAVSVLIFSGCSIVTPVKSSLVVSFGSSVAGRAAYSYTSLEEAYKDCEFVLKLDPSESGLSAPQPVTVKNSGTATKAVFSDLEAGVYELSVQAYKTIDNERVLIGSDLKPVTVEEHKTASVTVKLTLDSNIEIKPQEHDTPEVPDTPVEPEVVSGAIYVSSDSTFVVPEESAAIVVSTLEDALTKAADTSGADTIVLTEDLTFTSTLKITTDVTIVPYNKSVTVTFDGSSEFTYISQVQAGVYINNANVIFKGLSSDKTLTFTGKNIDFGKYFMNMISPQNGPSGTLTFGDNFVVKDVTSTNSVLYVDNSEFVLDGAKVEGCAVTDNGDGLIRGNGSSTMKLISGTVTSNTSGTESDGTGKENCIFYIGSKSLSVGSEKDSGKSLNISGNTIYGRSGAMNISSGITVNVLSNVDISLNKVPAAASSNTCTAGIFLSKSTLTFTGSNVNISGNTVGAASSKEVNDIYVNSGSKVVINEIEYASKSALLEVYPNGIIIE